MAEWIHVARTPLLMDTTHAKTQLGWRPEHTAAETLAEMAAAVKVR
jgi:nucleoside-diphosphate-sugar epimerase